MRKDRERWWAPTYTSSKGKLVQINEVNSAECPVSLLAGDQFQLLQDWAESKKFEGCSMYGPDLSRWPADTFDAFAIFAAEESRVEFAKLEADR